jgi:cellulose synthase/poly-beta-1,6-N-acetylglucosamine synthase-like glycosyltransferase
MLEIILWIFLISAGIQFLFFSIVAIAISVYKSPESSPDQSQGISVIICANNEYENLLKLIPVLLKQNHQKFEVVLVDDNSSDKTYDFAIELELREKLFKLLRIDETPDHIQNKKYGITLGVKAAKYDHVLLTDADCMPSGDSWISEMSKGFSSENKSFVVGYSQYETNAGFLNHFIKYETILTAINYVGLGLLGNPYMAVGRNLAYTKSVFLKNKGFGKFQGVVGGDDDLLINQHATRKNTSIVLSPEAMVYSIPKASFGEFLRQKTRHLSVGKHYRMPDKLVLGLLTISKITFWISFIAAIMSVNQTILIGGCFLLVMVSLLTSVLALKKKTGDDSSIWLFPLLDFIYLFYYISTGLKVLFTKKVRWK